MIVFGLNPLIGVTHEMYKRKADDASLEDMPQIRPAPQANTTEGRRVDFELAVQESFKARLQEYPAINDAQLVASLEARDVVAASNFFVLLNISIFHGK